MQKQTITFAITMLLLGTHTPAYAGEINYGSLKEQYGDTLLLEYKGPAGTTYYTCTENNECSKKTSTIPTLSPSVLGSTTYVKSSDGTLAVKQTVLGTATYYFLYDISGKTAKKLSQIPFLEKGATVSIAKNNTAVLFTNGTTYTRYDIATKKLSTLTLPKTLAFFSISPNGNYLSGYNYTTVSHEIWSFADKKKYSPPSSMQSYVEFSQDESRIAYLDDVKGFKTLFTMKTSDLGKSAPTSLVQLTKPNTETEDYIFAGATLFFMANVDGPLEWDLFAYNNGKTTLVDTDVSYGDYLKVVRTSEATYLAYQKTEGKNTNITLYNGENGKTTLTPAPKSPVSTKITREVKEYGDRTGVLLTPQKTSNANLFIWMHGGPQRQVAKGYHPYLSYAVYDELLERLVEGGNYVYKIDYTGSTGYGADFRKALSMNIGKVEMDDIENAIDDLKKDLGVKNVYLIGNSYGGYMAFRGIVDTPEKLNGVVSINGVSDWYGLISNIPSSIFTPLFNGVPDTTNMDAYLQASVFTGMDELKKDDKVLVVWGEQDATVPVSQSTKYLEFAKANNVNVGSLSFPTEEHILRSRKTLDSLCKKVTSFLEIKKVSCTL
jgi:poly(3-hydroxybutyrate) depolymerase